MQSYEVHHLIILGVFSALLTIAWGNWSPEPQWNPDIGNEIIEKKKVDEEIIDSIFSGGEGCLGKRCIESDQCCKGSACVDVDGMKLGTCLPIYGRNEGQPCEHDTDCSNGLRCLETGKITIPKRCQDEVQDKKKKLYNDECTNSLECDSSKGLCCQLQRRHRMAPRRVCYYFSDPKSCIGTINSSHMIQTHFLTNPFFKARMG